MRKLTLSFLICMFCLASVSAQAGREQRDHEPPTAEQRTERLVERLGLNEQQANSLLEIFIATDLEREAMKAELETLTRQDMCALMISTSSQVEAVLTAEQYAELDEMMQRRADHRAEHANMKGKKGRKGRPSLEDCENPSESA